ncbi:MAG TPA: hypothetical protein VJA83_04360, partial [Sulfuricurvum sp.]|nr:hypothetical protein [Sulfuricurvum sp.]
MKKIYTLIMSALMLGFCGCAGVSPEAEAGVKIEKVVATYKIGAYTDVDSTKSKLSSAGFDVVGTYKTDAGTTVLYTNAAMKATANKATRGLAAVGRILVDDERKQISIANPVYFGKAFMQKEYNHTTASAVLGSLEKAFGPLKDSTDKWEFAGLAGYHFMVGMPYYEDMSVVGEGSTADLVAKVQKAKGTTAVVKLSADRYVAFVTLERRTNGFVKKIYTLIMSALVLGFCGCAGVSPEAEAGVKVEKVVATYK